MDDLDGPTFGSVAHDLLANGLDFGTCLLTPTAFYVITPVQRAQMVEAAIRHRGFGPPVSVPSALREELDNGGGLPPSFWPTVVSDAELLKKMWVFAVIRARNVGKWAASAREGKCGAEGGGRGSRS